ncbi:GNAT family N-acetyltransferase [Streptosporangium sp. NPDC000396]|uniref:GNAT family N-acetyltransferase n=1 Tax=Streptosporangium sp. NPDC000396 TaxID=3366185 RepID=UPI0036C84877
MGWTFTSNVEVYAGAAEPWLLRDPVRNTVPLTVLRGIRSGVWGDDLLLGWLEQDGETVAAACQTPPRPLLLPVMPTETVRDLATELIDSERPIPGVSGPLPQAEAFAGAWWLPEAERRSERLYRLGSLVRPRPFPEGASRTAVAADVDRLVRWYGDFQIEAGSVAYDNLTPLVASRVSREELVLWEVEGRPVAFAAVTSPIAGVSRIGPVYTSPEFRRKGYGTAVTHAVTARAQAGGATEVLLFTDLSNPTSNAIYQAIGYRPVADYVSIRFG